MLKYKELIKYCRHKRLRNLLCLFVIFFNLFFSALSQNENQDNQKVKKVYLLHADTLIFDKKVSSDYHVLKGDVQFRQDSAYMYCDSAYFYEGNNSFDAFGNVKMEQGDTLFVYGDVLYYDGNDGLARLRDNVRMINNDVVLTTDSLNYDRYLNIGYFFDGGTITNMDNILNSIYGEYSPDTKMAIFEDDVELINPKFIRYSNNLEYNTETGVADIVGPSEIVSDSNTIYSDKGWYDTKSDVAMLLNRSQIVGTGQMLTGDTIYYDRNTGYGEVFGNMLLNDSVRHLILEGGYGYYNELTENAFATKRAVAIEYSGTDSLFLHADTLKSSVIDNSRILQAYYGVRFFRPDGQGVCDSLKYSTADSTIVMYDNPVLWNQNYQIYGDTIFISMNDSTIEKVKIKDFSFMVQQKTKDFYDQITGKVMDIYFTNGAIRQLDVSGNVQTIFFPEEDGGKSFTGMNRVESSFMTANIFDQKLQKLIMKPKANGSLTPIPMLTSAILHLDQFRWYDNLRPKTKDDIFRKVEMTQEQKVEKTNYFTNVELEGNTDD